MKKVALITGASSGIGESLAVYAASHGYDVALLARNKENLHMVAERCKQAGAKVCFTVGDVSKPQDCMRFIDDALRNFGTFHVLINNAGLSMRAIFNETDVAVIHQLMDVNFWGTVNCTKYALPELLR